MTGTVTAVGAVTVHGTIGLYGLIMFGIWGSGLPAIQGDGVATVSLFGQVVGFTACTSHLVDLGGLGMGPEGSDIHDEGLFIPPCKLVDQGEVAAAS